MVNGKPKKKVASEPDPVLEKTKDKKSNSGSDCKCGKNCKCCTGCTGPAGPEGPEGPQGAQGQRGPHGPKGERGQEGCSGQKGASGHKGAPGEKGERGRQGNQGHPGPKGCPGNPGCPGPKGCPGATGATGATGVTGSPGETGVTGSPGETGATGATGEKGETGPAGKCCLCFDFDGITSPSSTSQIFTLKSSDNTLPEEPENSSFQGQELGPTNDDGFDIPQNDYQSVWHCEDERWASVLNTSSQVNIFNSNIEPDSPGEQTDNDGAYTLGVQFNTSENGRILAIRFYKAIVQGVDSDTDITYNVQLWSQSALMPLGQGSAIIKAGVNGWQEIALATPVAITVGTTYIASYTTDPTGYYAFTSNFFTTAATNLPLTAPASDDVTNGNGVFASDPDTKPTSTFNRLNYWVDVAFAPNDVPQYLIKVQTGNPVLDCIKKITVNTRVQLGSSDESILTSTYNLYIWNFDTSDWELVYTNDLPVDHGTNTNFTNIEVILNDVLGSDYVGPDRYINFFQQAPNANVVLSMDCFSVCLAACSDGTPGATGAPGHPGYPGTPGRKSVV